MIVRSMNCIRPFALGLSLMAACSALAEDPRWYRVELLIFSHQSGSAAGSERWNPTPTLAYPEAARFLVDPQRVADNLALYDANSAMNEFGHQTLTIIPPPPESEEEGGIVLEQGLSSVENLDAIAGLDATPIQNADPNTPSTDPNAPAVPPEILPTTPSPFVVLANAELEFRGKAAYMQKTGRYKTLFHESWLQPMIEGEAALPIIVDRSGDAQDWPLLQGSIKFHLSRYLHLETNIWLNTTGDYLPLDWDMPQAPLGPPSLSIVYPPEPDPELELNLDFELALEPEVELQPDLPSEPIEAGFPILDGEMQIESEILQPLGPVSPWRHAILLQQKRKMRSTEVHYIDHPMLGIVVKVTPVTEEELQERALAELAIAEAEAEAQAAALNR